MGRGLARCAVGTKLLDVLDSPRARRHWSGWKGVRCVIAYTIWWFRFRQHPANCKPREIERAPRH